MPKDGDFRRASDGIHYYLARQGRRVVLRGGNVTSLLQESRLHWIHDPNPNQSHRVKPRQTVPRNNNNTVPRNAHNTVPRNTNNTVPRNNNVVRNSDSLSRNPLEPIPSTSWYNSNFPIPSASSPIKLCLRILNQCPGLLTMRILKPPKCLTMLSALLRPLRKRGIENTEEKDVREREKIEVILLFMMRAGSISAQQFQAVQSFQQE